MAANKQQIRKVNKTSPSRIYFGNKPRHIIHASLDTLKISNVKNVASK